jgi:hypothetical protein
LLNEANCTFINFFGLSDLCQYLKNNISKTILDELTLLKYMPKVYQELLELESIFTLQHIKVPIINDLRSIWSSEGFIRSV